MRTPRPTRPLHAAPLLLWGALLAAAALILGHFVSPSGMFGNVTFLALGWGASAFAWIGAWRAPAGARLVPRLVAAGITASALGDLVYSVYAWNGSEPDVSLADIPWFASYLGLGTALVVTLVRGRGRGRERVDIDAVIDVLTVVTMSLLVFWEMWVEGIVEDSSVSVGVRAVWAAYPIADAVLVALVLRTLASRRSRASIGAAFAVGAISWLAADLAFLLSASGTVTRWTDVGWMLGALLIARAAWRRPSPVTDDTDELGAPGGLRTLAIAVLPMTLPSGMAIWHGVYEGQEGPTENVIASSVLLVLLFLRAARLLRSERRAKAEARRSHRYYARLAATSSDAVVVVDADGRLLTESPQLAALLDFDGPTLGADALELLRPVDLDALRAVFARVTATPGESLDDEGQVRDVGGRETWLSARIVNLLDDPDVGGVIIALHDISDRKRAEGALFHQAFHDVLTGLPNRALYRDRVEHALRRNARTGLDPAVLFLDLDGFKNVNDSLGHDGGDELLREVASRLLGAVRADDTVARMGGDEFAILVEQSERPVDEARMIADRVLKALTAPFEIAGSRITLSASIGIAASDDDRSTASALLRNADIAMYRAKAGGKAQWVTYEPHMRAAAMERLQLETDLEHALEAGEFHLVYQPVVELETQQTVGFEALLRWQHPTLGVVMPDTFIPISEESGSIVPIGLWVLRTACVMGARWQRQFPRAKPLTMAVNLSARQLAADDLVAQVAEALAYSGLDPTTLVLEMTETVLIKDATLAALRLAQLRTLGVRLAIDDFGTGYSSLSYLKQFPVDILKIDRSFINTITDRTKIPAIVRGLLDLGRTLELETIAEGVEDDIQRDGLRDEHCQLAQGYLFARPLDPVDAEAMLALMAAQDEAARLSRG